MVAMKKIPGRVSGNLPSSVQGAGLMNSFSGGLKTEFTGLNFPENSCTNVSNCIFTIQGDVTRRAGFDEEVNGSTFGLASNIPTASVAINTYKWNNVGGDGLTQIVVVQLGSTLLFFQSSNATVTSPLSTTFVGSDSLLFFQAINNTDNVALTECQFADGNGYLFVFHPSCDPFFVTFTSGTLTAKVIPMQIRDFQGLIDGLTVNFRPNTLSTEHQYNLQNQGWTSGAPWSATMTGTTSGNVSAGNSATFTINNQTNTNTVTNGSQITWNFSHTFGGSTQTGTIIGTVTSYLTPFTSITILASYVIQTVQNPGFPPNSVNFVNPNGLVGSAFLNNVGFIQAWFTALGLYPANSDIWWLYKNTSNVFDPQHTIANVQQPIGPAPNGTYLLNPFIQDRSAVSSIPGITVVNTVKRPRTGTWFASRVWYSGVDANFPAQGDAPYQTWTENIYFSQIVQSPANFGQCYQANDPTDQTLFDLQPDDGGVIVIQGTGSIYKLFPITNGLLVFAANGIWFITGNTGIGFTANDFVVTKISNVRSISGTSIVNVLGYPLFWNEEGIYQVSPNQTNTPYGFGGLSVQDVTVQTIKTFYRSIPLISKKFARGDYNPITFVVSWIYRSTNEAGISNRYNFDSALNYNTLLQCFYPYTVAESPSTPFLSSITYVEGPGGSTSPTPTFKYVELFPLSPLAFTFAEERDTTNLVDFFSFNSAGVSYNSSFAAGYSKDGQALVKWRPEYVYIYSRENSNTSYQVQGIFDYVVPSAISSRITTPVISTNPTPITYASGLSPPVTISDPSSNMVYRRHRLRGNGMVFQLLINSVPGQPFDIMGWAIYDTKNASV